MLSSKPFRRFWVRSLARTHDLDTLCNVVIAATALVALIYASSQLNDLEESDKRKAALDHIFRLRESTSENTRPAVRLITHLVAEGDATKRVLNEEVALKIMRGEPFRVPMPAQLADANIRAGLQTADYDKLDPLHQSLGYSHLLSPDGVVDARTSNVLRYALVKYFNAWENLILAAWEGRADCSILFEHYIRFFAEESYFPALRPFNVLYDHSYNAAAQARITEGRSAVSKASWVNIHELMEYKQSGRKLDAACFCSYKAPPASWFRRWWNSAPACDPAPPQN